MHRMADCLDNLYTKLEQEDLVRQLWVNTYTSAYDRLGSSMLAEDAANGAVKKYREAFEKKEEDLPPKPAGQILIEVEWDEPNI